MSEAVLKECEGKLASLKELYSGDGVPAKPDECKKLIRDLKLLFIEFPSFLSPTAKTSTRSKEVAVVRETMEHAVLLAVATKNMDDFEKHFEILRVYYTDFPDEPKSERRLLILGLHLLRLLAVNKTRTYHMELERIAVTDQDNMYIKDVVQLERYNMEGSYHKMLQARSKVPSSHYVPLMEMLLETVRREVFRCAMGAYESLSVDGARRLLMFENTDDLLEFVTEESKKLGNSSAWIHQGDKFLFSEAEHHDQTTLPFIDVMKDQLYYSHELQRIA